MPRPAPSSECQFCMPCFCGLSKLWLPGVVVCSLGRCLICLYSSRCGKRKSLGWTPDILIHPVQNMCMISPIKTEDCRRVLSTPNLPRLSTIASLAFERWTAFEPRLRTLLRTTYTIVSFGLTRADVSDGSGPAAANRQLSALCHEATCDPHQNVSTLIKRVQDPNR